MPQENIQINTQLDSPDQIEDHALQAILSSALKARSDFQPSADSSYEPCWPAEHFNLDRVALYSQSSEREQFEILKYCSDNLLAEAYYIEKCGMYFAAKMALMAESAQERMLYSLFSADEAMHFSWITKYTDQDKVADYLQEPFIQLLDEILRKEDRVTLSYIVQIVLEGWGITHYHALARDCRDNGLKRVFENIIKDEARHHRSGVVMFNEQKHSDEQVANITNILTRLFQMVQCGPQMVVSQIERIKGGLSREVKEKIFEELDCEAETAKKLDLLKSLIGSAANSETILGELAHRDALRPFSASECASLSACLRP